MKESGCNRQGLTSTLDGTLKFLTFRDANSYALHNAGEVRIFNILKNQVSRLVSVVQANVCGFIC